MITIVFINDTTIISGACDMTNVEYNRMLGVYYDTLYDASI